MTFIAKTIISGASGVDSNSLAMNNHNTIPENIWIQLNNINGMFFDFLFNEFKTLNQVFKQWWFLWCVTNKSIAYLCYRCLAWNKCIHWNFHIPWIEKSSKILCKRKNRDNIYKLFFLKRLVCYLMIALLFILKKTC